MSMNGDYLSMAEACGDYERPSGHVYFPGENFDPFDPDDVEAVRMVGESDRFDRMSALESENARLRAALEDQ